MPGESVIAVVGAHMSGLPLNRELAGRGGRFLQATSTAALYKLVLLPGGPPFRPGLLRVGEGGAAIALEVWALPEAAFGAFIAGVPSPLAIGTVKLADGRSVLGFQVEEIATRDAKDISHHGGWRAFMASDARPAAVP
jgi:allophanate hydrolase